jgi:hypothetical protein
MKYFLSYLAHIAISFGNVLRQLLPRHYSYSLLTCVLVQDLLVSWIIIDNTVVQRCTQALSLLARMTGWATDLILAESPLMPLKHRRFQSRLFSI